MKVVDVLWSKDGGKIRYQLVDTKKLTYYYVEDYNEWGITDDHYLFSDFVIVLNRMITNLIYKAVLSYKKANNIT